MARYTVDMIPTTQDPPRAYAVKGISGPLWRPFPVAIDYRGGGQACNPVTGGAPAQGLGENWWSGY